MAPTRISAVLVLGPRLRRWSQAGPPRTRGRARDLGAGSRGRRRIAVRHRERVECGRGRRRRRRSAPRRGTARGGCPGAPRPAARRSQTDPRHAAGRRRRRAPRRRSLGVARARRRPVLADLRSRNARGLAWRRQRPAPERVLPAAHRLRLRRQSDPRAGAVQRQAETPRDRARRRRRGRAPHAADHDRPWRSGVRVADAHAAGRRTPPRPLGGRPPSGARAAGTAVDVAAFVQAVGGDAGNRRRPRRPSASLGRRQHRRPGAPARRRALDGQRASDSGCSPGCAICCPAGTRSG